ncbi:MAG TPA: sigma-70 family RNA polymerase sigma factor [Acidobacteriota bacterium]|nr:sigma-70 family RNA polymerase sigma factor [Acidobacteriota bacterium]
MSADPDIGVVDAVLRGDDEAFEQLVLRYQKPILGLILRMCGDPGEAPDIAQRVFLKAYTKLQTFRRRSSFKTWLYSIAMNLCRNELRRRKRWGYPQQIEETSVGVDPAVEDGLIGNERRQLLADGVELLPPMQKAVLVLRIYQELSFQEIGRTLGISENSAKVNFHYAVRRLREKLKER